MSNILTTNSTGYGLKTGDNGARAGNGRVETSPFSISFPRLERVASIRGHAGVFDRPRAVDIRSCARSVTFYF